MTKYSIVDYTTKFQYKELTPIRGQPSLDSILQLYRQIKRNAQSIPCKLGGGQLRYLGLVLTDRDYISIPNTAEFVRSTDPGTFQVRTPTTTARLATRTTSSTHTTPTITAVNIASQKAQHEERERCY